MKPIDIALAIAIAVIWGVGFVLTRIAVDEMSATLLTTLRFGITALPCLFLPRPKLSWGLIIAISWLLVAQFLAQTYGLAHGVPAGLTAVIVQSQALFTVAFAAIFLRELPTRLQVLGIAIATCGLLLICFTVGYDFSVWAFSVSMTAPVSFAVSNLMLRRAQDVSMLDLFAWIGLIAMIPLLIVLLFVEGPAVTWQALTHVSLLAAVCVLALAVLGDDARLLDLGPSAAEVFRRAGGAVRAACAVFRRRCVEYCFRRDLRDVAPDRHDRCRVRYCSDAALAPSAASG